MTEKMEDALSYALDDSDVEKILGKDIFIFTYPYLKEVDHIDQVFDKKGRSMMLFLTENTNTGHWCCMMKKGKRIDYYDPYGGKPDEDMKWLSNNKKEELGEEDKLLTKLLKESGYQVWYNNVPYQSESADVATCGRWSAMRLYYKKLNDKQFYDLIQKGCKDNDMSPDEYICFISNKIIGK